MCNRRSHVARNRDTSSYVEYTADLHKTECVYTFGKFSSSGHLVQVAPFKTRTMYLEGISQCYAPSGFLFGVGFAGRRDLGLGSRAGQS